MPNHRLLAVAGVVVIVATCCAFSISSTGDALVVYCAHDSVYSEKLLDKFEEQTGMEVAVRFDTEGTKSLGLVNLLIQEQKHPRCDVFWNNELLGTLDLQDAGVLEPYKGPGYERVPDQYKDPNGHWAGFGGRLRVGIFNYSHNKSRQFDFDQALADRANEMVFANPLYGTTRTHFTVLWHYWGEQKLSEWHRDIVERGALAVQGNAMVKNMVAASPKRFGWTDTDDFFIAKDQQHSVEMEPIRLDNGTTICIPNTVAIIKGTQRIDAAKALVDFLLSSETELALSRSQSRQIPLGQCDESELSDEVRRLRGWAMEAYDLRRVASSRQACLDWLKSEYLK